MTHPTGVDGQRVAKEIVLIRAALKAQGYTTRKLSRRAIWSIQSNSEQTYQLTFQPAPDRG